MEEEERSGLLGRGSSSVASRRCNRAPAYTALGILSAVLFVWSLAQYPRPVPPTSTPAPVTSHRHRARLAVEPLLITTVENRTCPLPPQHCTISKATGRCVPSFFVVGAMKGASTALINALSVHPNVNTYPMVWRHGGPFVAEEKLFEHDDIWTDGDATLGDRLERYFTERIFLWSEDDSGQRTYHVTDRSIVFPGQCKISGSKTPTYLARPDAAGRLLELFPDAKILVSLREPLSRISSQVHMERQHVCQPDAPCTAEVLDAELRAGFAVERQHISECNRCFNLFGQGPGPLIVDHQEAFASRMECWPDQAHGGEEKSWFHERMLHSMYAPALERYFTLFGRDRVKVILFDEWVAHEEAVFGEVVDWLGLPPLPEGARLPDSFTSAEVHDDDPVPHYRMAPDLQLEYRAFLRPYIAPLRALLPDVTWPASWDVWWSD